ncbi:MAG: hypothetical protein V1763_00030 [Parcubacteria group bacterium]
MFDKNKPQQPSPIAQPSSPEKIFTMPMEYYLGENTISATRLGKTVQVAANKPATKVGAVPRKKTQWWLWILLLLAVIGSAILLVKSFETPAVPTPPVQTPVVTPTPTPVVVPPVEENNTVNNSTANNATTFSPANLKKFSLSLMSAVDSDKDGLTDSEETIFTTDPNLKDTDTDGYLDGEEGANFYSPVDKTLTRLWGKNFVSWYENATYDYKFLYPSGWLVKSVDATNPSEIMIMSDRNEFINILQDKKTSGQTLDDWYLEQAPSVQASDLKHYETYNKIPVLESPDGFTVYFSQGDTIYIINYNIGIAEEANYPAIFSMVLNSFQFVQ